jgi:hypothetical protein
MQNGIAGIPKRRRLVDLFVLHLFGLGREGARAHIADTAGPFGCKGSRGLTLGNPGLHLGPQDRPMDTVKAEAMRF